MALIEYKLGDLITQRKEKNPGGDLPIRGVSKNGLIPPKQIDADTSIYNLYYRNDFVYNPARMELGSIAFNDEYDMAICSSLYEIFFVHRTDLVIPEYLALFVSKPEFARCCDFLSSGSAREYCRFANISEIKITLPSIEEQRKIVHDYKVVSDRIELLKKINENLEAQAYATYLTTIEDIAEETTLSDLAIITMGTSPEGEELNDKGEGIIFYQGKTDFGFRFPSVRMYTTDAKRYAEKNDILMSVRAPVGSVNIANVRCAIGRGIASIRPKDGCYSFLYYTMKKLNFELNKFNDEGTVFGSITKDDLFGLKVTDVESSVRKTFDAKISVIDGVIATNEQEIVVLETINTAILSNMGKEVKAYAFR